MTTMHPQPAEFARFLLETQPDEIPREAIERAKLLILDTLGALIAASAEKYSAGRIMAEFVRELGGNGESAVVGRTFRTNCMLAALANGTMAYYCDVEPHNPEPIVHGMAIVVPACLAVGEKTRCSGLEFLGALVLGLEAACRISRSIDPSELYRRGFHPTSICGGFGAAVAAGRLLGLAPGQFRSALGLAATQASGLLAWETDPSEHARPFNPGIAARNGVTAALLARGGFAGPADVFDGKWSIYRAYSAVPRIERLTDRLGNDYAVMECAIKKYACCAFIHPGLDALFGILDDYALDARQIERIVLRFASSGVALIDNNPLRSHCAQYILPIGALERKVVIDDFLCDRRSEPAIARLSRLVTVIADDELDPFFPHGYPTVLELTAGDGRCFSRRVDYAHGTPQNPVGPDYVHRKFQAMTGPLIPAETGRQIMELVSRLDELDDISRLAELLAFDQGGETA